MPIGQGSQYWQCSACGAIRADRELVAACCQQIPNQVQICSTCLRTHNQALRIGECQCNQRDFIIRDSKTQLLLYGHQALKASVRNNRSEELLVFRIPAEAWVAFLQIGLQHIPPAAIPPVVTYLKAVQRSQSFNPDPSLLEDIDNVLEISLEGAEFLQRSVDEHPAPDDADCWINIWPN